MLSSPQSPWSPAEPPTRPADTPVFRKLETRRGDYFVRWLPEHVTALLRCEELRPEDLDTGNADRRHRLVKDLFLLGLQDELGHGGPSLLSRYARTLMPRAV